MSMTEPHGAINATESYEHDWIMLLIEDNAGDVRLLREMLNYRAPLAPKLIHVATMGEAEEQLARTTVDIILLDLGLPDAQGLEAVRRACRSAPTVPLVVLTGLDDEELAAQALQEGAQDYLIKGEIDSRSLRRTLRYSTERKRLERLKDEFVSTVSHELRTPLTSIAVSLSLLMAKTARELPEAARRLLEITHANTQRLVRLVDDILDIEKMEAGQTVFRFKRVEVRPLVEQAIEANQGFAESLGVRIRLEPGRGVPEVRADPDRLVQVITNLLSNASKFSPRDREVVVSITADSEIVRISVRDHGQGIATEFKSRIFEKFAQADATSTRRKGGTGLGLSIVKQIVERLGGCVGFADAPGGGTVFNVDLPSWGHVSGTVIDPTVQAETPRILLCEDDPDLAFVMRAQLSEVGFATDFALTMADALIRATEVAYSAILVDLQLPDGDGISLILRLRELPQCSNTPIIVVSADPGRGREDARASELTVLGWLRKPVNIPQLILALSSTGEQTAS